MESHKELIENFFSALNARTMHLVDEFYALDAEFCDPVVKLSGRDAIRNYYLGLYGSVQSIAFEFSQILEEGDSCAAAWTMNLVTPKLSRGMPVVLPGMSHIRFDSTSGLALYHRDYFDLGAFIYEQVPVLGSLVRFAKSRLH